MWAEAEARRIEMRTKACMEDIATRDDAEEKTRKEEEGRAVEILEELKHRALLHKREVFLWRCRALFWRYVSFWWRCSTLLRRCRALLSKCSASKR